jgi:hypothetical protein
MKIHKQRFCDRRRYAAIRTAPDWQKTIDFGTLPSEIDMRVERAA